MHILMTGFTALQINSSRRPIEKIDVPASIVESLEAAGHTVDWRRVIPGEDLSHYDVTWINLAPMHSLNGRAGAMGALWALQSDRPAVGFFDDWQFSAVFNGAKAMKRRPEMLYKHLLSGERGEAPATHWSRESAQAAKDEELLRSPGTPEKKISVDRYYFTNTDEEVKPYEAELLRGANSVLGPRWTGGMVPVCPMYGWGDRAPVRKRMLKEIGPIEALDPSSTIYPLIAPVIATPYEEKRKEWVLGALMPHDDWVDKKNWAWPIEYLGSKKMVANRDGKRVKTETDVIDRYNESWGILSPPYMHAGSGWWRSRFMYAAVTRGIIVCDKKEADILGPAHRVTHTEVERMSTDQLIATAEAQAAELRVWMPPVERFGEHVNQIVERAVRDHRGV